MQKLEIEGYTLEERAMDNADFKKEVFGDPESFLQTGTLFFEDNVPYSAREELLKLARTSSPQGKLSNFGRIKYKDKTYVWSIVNRMHSKITIYQE